MCLDQPSPGGSCWLPSTLGRDTNCLSITLHIIKRYTVITYIPINLALNKASLRLQWSLRWSGRLRLRFASGRSWWEREWFYVWPVADEDEVLAAWHSVTLSGASVSAVAWLAVASLSGGLEASYCWLHQIHAWIEIYSSSWSYFYCNSFNK